MSESTYTDEMRQRDVRLAQAMGWTRIKGRIGVSPNGELDYTPLFHSSHVARAQLLEWLAAQSKNVQLEFCEALYEEIRLQKRTPFVVMSFMLATPEQVAVAAARALKLEEKE